MKFRSSERRRCGSSLCHHSSILSLLLLSYLVLLVQVVYGQEQGPCFETKQELQDAIGQYIDGDNHVRGTYGDPMNTWCVSKITDFSGLFAGYGAFNEDLHWWDTSKVTNMQGCFERCVSFFGQVQTWDVSKVTSFQSMFRQATRFTGDLSVWDMSNAQDVSFMFYNAASIQTDLSAWNVGKVLTFESFASAAGNLNSDITAWDVSAANNFVDMFGRGAAMDKNLCAWGNKMNRFANVENMFGSRDYTASNCPNPFDPAFDVRPPGPFCHPCGAADEQTLVNTPTSEGGVPNVAEVKPASEVNDNGGGSNPDITIYDTSGASDNNNNDASGARAAVDLLGTVLLVVSVLLFQNRW